MMNKIIAHIALIMVVILGTYSYLNDLEIESRIIREHSEIMKSMNENNIFTNTNGQNLCESVRIIAQESYGFMASGKPLPECNYLKKP